MASPSSSARVQERHPSVDLRALVPPYGRVSVAVLIPHVLVRRVLVLDLRAVPGSGLRLRQQAVRWDVQRVQANAMFPAA